MITHNIPTRRDRRAWYSYALIAYAIFATASWMRSAAHEPSSHPPLTAAEVDCDCERTPHAWRTTPTQDTARASAFEASAGAAADLPARSAGLDSDAVEIGLSLLEESYGSTSAELEDPAALIASLERMQRDPTLLPDDRLEVAFVLRRLQSTPPTAEVASELLELAAARPDPQLALDVLEVIDGSLEPRHAEALMSLTRSDSAAVRNATMLHLYGLLRDPDSRGALLPVIEGHSPPLDALAQYVRSDG